MHVRRTPRPVHRNRHLIRMNRHGPRRMTNLRARRRMTNLRARRQTTNLRARRRTRNLPAHRRTMISPRLPRRTTARQPRPRTTVRQTRLHARNPRGPLRTTLCTRATRMVGMYTTHLTRRPARPGQGLRTVTGTRVRRLIRMNQPALTVRRMATLLLRGNPIRARLVRVDRAPRLPRPPPRPRRRGTERGAAPVRTTARRARR